MKSVEHRTSSTLPYCVTDRGSWEKVRNMVHFAVNHQARADATWYQATIKSLGHSSIISKKQFPEGNPQRDVLIATLFCEILATIMVSHAINAFYITMDRPVPPLPTFSEDWDTTVTPTYKDVVTQGIFKSGKGLRWPDYNKKGAVIHTPMVLAKDLDFKGKALTELYSASMQEYLKASLIPIHPFIGLSVAPQAMNMASSILAAKLALPDDINIASWKRLDKTKFFCTQNGFTRADFELIQTATAECYDTVY